MFLILFQFLFLNDTLLLEDDDKIENWKLMIGDIILSGDGGWRSALAVGSAKTETHK
jgi:hypothetical protein